MPLMEALSHRKTVFIRDNPLNRAMHARLGYTRNVVLYDSTRSLVKLLRAAEPGTWVEDIGPEGNGHSWASHTRDVKQLLEQSLAQFSYERTLIPRLWFSRVARQVQVGPSEREVALTREVAELRTVLGDRERRIQELLASASWTVTRPLRKVAGLWMNRQR
jgi:hypothetical protein